jgi:enoyl-CoA hydratase/carnithine racemase
MIRHDTRDGVAWITLARPERLNSFVVADHRALRAAVDAAHAAPDTRVVVITGEGRAFSAGADRSLLDGTASDEEREQAGVEFTAMLEAFGRCELPVIAAVNGLAVGLGATLLLHCDFVVMAESARLRLPFTALGLGPEAGSSVLLPARARWDDALWAMLSSEWIDAADARAMGYAWRVVPDAQLLDETAAVAATLAALDPAAVAATKRLLLAGRAEAVAGAMQREFAAMHELSLRRPRPEP